MDWYSRYILSWRASVTLEHDFCVEALEEAIAIYGKLKIFDTGQEVQFTSEDVLNVLEDQALVKVELWITCSSNAFGGC